MTLSTGPSGNATTAPTTVSKSSSSFFADGKKYTKSGSKFCSDPTCQKGIGSTLRQSVFSFLALLSVATVVRVEGASGAVVGAFGSGAHAHNLTTSCWRTHICLTRDT